MLEVGIPLSKSFPSVAYISFIIKIPSITKTAMAKILSHSIKMYLSKSVRIKKNVGQANIPARNFQAHCRECRFPQWTRKSLILDAVSVGFSIG